MIAGVQFFFLTTYSSPATPEKMKLHKNGGTNHVIHSYKILVLLYSWAHEQRERERVGSARAVVGAALVTPCELAPFA